MNGNDDKLLDFEVQFFQISLGEILSVVEAQQESLWCQQFGFSPNSRILVMG